MRRPDAEAIFKQIEGRRILVVGDIMLDKYIWGKTERLSPEAPVPVLDVEKETYVPGGAANVANNLLALGADPHLCGYLGDDQFGEVLIEELDKRGINSKLLVYEYHKPTITKVRVISSKQQMARYDFENRDCISDESARRILDMIRTERWDGIIFSDYDKGMNNPVLIRSLIEIANNRGIPMLIDPKVKDPVLYAGATLIKPNMKEALAFTKQDKGTPVDKICDRLVSITGSNILITMADKGMYLCQKDGKAFHIDAYDVDLYDVTGAGDTVSACMIGCMSAGIGLKESVELASAVAATNISIMGTSAATVDQIMEKCFNEKD